MEIDVSAVDNRIQGNGKPAGGVRIDRLVLLAGAVRPSDLSRGTGRGALDLPITPTRTLLGEWCEQAGRVAALAGSDSLPVDVVLDPTSEAPNLPGADDRVRIEIRRDETSYRGTGGALRDIAASMDGHGVILVANAGQILSRGLDELTLRLASVNADVALVAHDDGTPSGLMLLSTRALADVNTVGFVDFKEQVLPTLCHTFDIRAVRFTRATAKPVRTLESYIAALRDHHDAVVSGGTGVDPFTERWAPTFSVPESGAEVDPTARLHDSVVLSGARVESGAVVVRSVIAADAVVGRGRIVVDEVVSSGVSRLGRSA